MEEQSLRSPRPLFRSVSSTSGRTPLPILRMEGPLLPSLSVSQDTFLPCQSVRGSQSFLLTTLLVVKKDGRCRADPTLRFAMLRYASSQALSFLKKEGLLLQPSGLLALRSSGALRGLSAPPLGLPAADRVPLTRSLRFPSKRRAARSLASSLGKRSLGPQPPPLRQTVPVCLAPVPPTVAPIATLSLRSRYALATLSLRSRLLSPVATSLPFKGRAGLLRYAMKVYLRSPFMRSASQQASFLVSRKGPFFS
jgi:hypothetical protein